MATYWSDMAYKRTCVYRFYDAAGDLLYVGLSMNFEGRVYKHRRKPWWPDVARTEFAWFDDRETAQQAERNAIYYEHPIHNIVRSDYGVV